MPRLNISVTSLTDQALS